MHRRLTIGSIAANSRLWADYNKYDSSSRTCWRPYCLEVGPETAKRDAPADTALAV